MLLLTAAVLKGFGMGADPVARSGVFSAPVFQFLVLAFEILLGFWLLSGTQPIGSWLVVLATFCGFAGVTFYQGWIGLASCGCAGRLITINPWQAFAVDIAIVAALLRFRPDLRPLRENPRASLTGALLPLAGGGLGTALILSLLAGLAHVNFGSTQGALAYLRGERLSVSPRLLDMGQGQPGETREATVELWNWTDKPVRLIGGTSDCSCVATNNLPLTIPPGEGRTINVKMRLPNANGMFNRTAFLMTDDDQARTLMFRLTGQIIKADEETITAQGNGG